MSPLLTVVIPTRDRAHSVGAAIRSVLDQSERSLEVVVVDQASTDDTKRVLEQLADSDDRVRVVSTDVATGAGSARNTGIDVAQGELLAFCDDDDLWLPGAAEALCDELREYPDAGFATSWHEVVHGDGAPVVFRGPLDIDDRSLRWHYFVPGSFGMIRRSSFSPDPRFDPGLPTCEDWDLWLRCAQERPLRVVARPLYRYRQHGGPRLTRDADGPLAGRRRFVEKHSPAMTPACRLYHEAAIDLLASRRAGAVGDLVSATRRSPAGAAFAGSVLAATAVAARIGIRRGDPGMAARLLGTLVRHEPSRRRGPR